MLMIKQCKVKEIGGILLSVSHGKFSFPSSLVFSFDVRSIEPHKSVGCMNTLEAPLKVILVALLPSKICCRF